MALAVVQVGEPGNDRGIHVERSGDTPPVIPDTTPVRDAVDAVVKIQPERRANDGKCLADDGGFANWGVCYVSFHFLIVTGYPQGISFLGCFTTHQRKFIFPVASPETRACHRERPSSRAGAFYDQPVLIRPRRDEC